MTWKTKWNVFWTLQKQNISDKTQHIFLLHLITWNKRYSTNLLSLSPIWYEVTRHYKQSIINNNPQPTHVTSLLTRQNTAMHVTQKEAEIEGKLLISFFELKNWDRYITLGKLVERCKIIPHSLPRWNLMIKWINKG